MIRVIDGGFLTTVQDAGRFEFRRYGVPQSGAMDDLSYNIANLLVGNFNGEAALEFTQITGKYQFLSDSTICLGGADFNFYINDKPIEIFKVYHVKKDDILYGHYPKKGFRSYLAISGGIKVPVVMGSNSTYLRGGFGGYKGRSLKKGDLIPVGSNSRKKLKELALSNRIFDRDNNKIRLVVNEFIENNFKNKVEFFFSRLYNVSMDMDRMGIRLEGKIEMNFKTDIITEPTPVGTVQITSSGDPIVLMNDCQTTGGYAIIGYVAPVDLRKLAQLRPFEKIEFIPASIGEAITLSDKRLSFYKKLRSSLELYNVY